MKVSDFMIDIDTELIVKKLRIVSKHLKAMADELEQVETEPNEIYNPVKDALEKIGLVSKEQW